MVERRPRGRDASPSPPRGPGRGRSSPRAPAPRRGRRSGRTRTRARRARRGRPSARGTARRATCRRTGRPPSHATPERDEPRLHVPVEALDGGEHLPAPELLRRPERVVPEVARELVEVALGRGGRQSRPLRDPAKLLLEADPVDQDAIPATKQRAGVLARLEAVQSGEREEDEVHVFTGVVEHAALPVAVERRLEERHERRPELPNPSRHPPCTAPGRRGGRPDPRSDQRSAGMSARACEPTSRSAFTSARFLGPVRDGGHEELGPRVDVHEPASSTSTTVGLTPRSESSPAATRRSSSGSIALLVRTRERPGLRNRTLLSQTTQRLRRDERAVDGQHDAEVVRGRAQPGDHAEDGSALARAVVETGNGERRAPSAALPTASTSSQTSPSRRQPALGERLAAEARERLRRAEALGGAADEQDSCGR